MTERKAAILVVEDEEAILLGLEENLKFSGYKVLTAGDGTKALDIALKTKPDLILLDIMLPGMSGYDVCRHIRDKGLRMPVIMLTARQDEFDKLHGFEMGADDYVTKPFSIKELLARIAAVLRRAQDKVGDAQSYEFGDFILDLEARTLRKRRAESEERRGLKKTKQLKVESSPPKADPPEAEKLKVGNHPVAEEISLTRTEFDLLEYFCGNEGKALSRDQVMNDVWGMQYFGTQRSLDSFVSSLRAKIEDDPHNPKHILTVHGVGYKFVK